MLEGRLEYLYDIVDYFVIIESDRTHSGVPKALNYTANMERYRKYSSKILYFPYSPDPLTYQETESRETGIYSPNMAMKMDHDQRNYISKALKLFGPETFVMISDLDEIPSKPAISLSTNSLSIAHPAIGLQQDMFFYNLNQKQTNPWIGTVITTNRLILEKNPQWFRENRWGLAKIADAGWHLTYWFSPEKIRLKIESFAHQELNTERFTNIDSIRERINIGQDPFSRDNKLSPVNRATLNPELMAIFSKYEPKY